MNKMLYKNELFYGILTAKMNITSSLHDTNSCNVHTIMIWWLQYWH